MPASWDRKLNEWVDASLIDAGTAARIRDFESRQAASQGLRWPAVLALAAGGVLLGAGVLLFVAAHWDELSPAARFTDVLLMVLVFHVAGAFSTERLPALATTLHAVGTVSVGAGIFLAGQIFNLREHWPGGVLLWAIGAIVGWLLLRDWVQATLAALLVPAWLAGEWMVAAGRYNTAGRLLLAGVVLLSIAYFTAPTSRKSSAFRRALMWIGGLGLLPGVIALVVTWDPVLYVPARFAVIGWIAMLGIPTLAAFWLRGHDAWVNLIAIPWVFLLGTQRYSTARIQIGLYLLLAAGAVGLAAWGLAEHRKERVNLGVAGFALTALFFYFSSIMDKLDRSLSLIGLGVLFLGGGWLLEQLRRRLLSRFQEPA